MYFMPKYRYNPESGREEDYLTLKESFRDKAGRVRTRTLLTVGSSRRRHLITNIGSSAHPT